MSLVIYRNYVFHIGTYQTYLYLWKANKTHILITQTGILFNLDHIEGFYLSFDGGDCSLKIIGHELMTEVVSKM